MVESGMYAIRPEIEFSGLSFHQIEEEVPDFFERNQDAQFSYNHDPGLPVRPFSLLPVFPSTLANLNDFKEEIPAKFLKCELPPRNSSETDEELSFLDFLEKIPPAEVTWEFDNRNRVLHFGQYFRKIFMGIADILYSYHKSNLFSGDVIGRMRIHNDQRITHPYTPANTSHNDLDGRSKKKKEDLDGRKVDIIHFRWLVAKVVRKSLGEDYESHLSKYFKLCFSELFLHSDGLERYYMFQYYHPVFYNDEDKYKLVHVLLDLRKRDELYFSQYFGLNDPEYGYRRWWLSLAEENDESMLGGVYFYKGNNNKVYDNNPNSLPIFLRNCHEHFTGGTETKNKRTIDRNRQIEKWEKIPIKNKKEPPIRRKRLRRFGQKANSQLELKVEKNKDRNRQIEKWEEIIQRMRHYGQQANLQPKLKIIDRDRQIGKWEENREKIQIKNKREPQRKRMRRFGQKANLQPELKFPPRTQKPLDQLPLHRELEPKITERFPGIYACMIDSCIRGFNDHGESRFGCTLAQLLFDESPFGCQLQQRVGGIVAATLQTEIAP